jgi:hypothetical protein
LKIWQKDHYKLGFIFRDFLLSKFNIDIFLPTEQAPLHQEYIELWLLENLLSSIANGEESLLAQGLSIYIVREKFKANNERKAWRKRAEKGNLKRKHTPPLLSPRAQSNSKKNQDKVFNDKSQFTPPSGGFGNDHLDLREEWSSQRPRAGSRDSQADKAQDNDDTETLSLIPVPAENLKQQKKNRTDSSAFTDRSQSSFLAVTGNANNTDLSKATREFENDAFGLGDRNSVPGDNRVRNDDIDEQYAAVVIPNPEVSSTSDTNNGPTMLQNGTIVDVSIKNLIMLSIDILSQTHALGPSASTASITNVFNQNSFLQVEYNLISQPFKTASFTPQLAAEKTYKMLQIKMSYFNQIK